MKKCIDCDHSYTTKTYSFWGGDRYIDDPMTCGNWKMEKVIEGDNSCATMRATTCGLDAIGFNEIDHAKIAFDKKRNDDEYNKYLIKYMCIPLAIGFAIYVGYQIYI